MGKQDWKLMKKDSDEIIYRSKDGENLNIFETDISVSTHKWGVQNHTLGVNKGFKTKQQALNWANAYMRTH